MDAGLFLAQFGHLADSPGGVGKLRNLILELAVRGQLVPQNPDDEPASDLLKRIEAEKARLIKAGEIRPSKPLPPIREDEILYDVPDGWVWVRVNEVGHDWGQKKPDQVFNYIDVGAIDQQHGVVNNPTVLSPTEAPSRARKIIRRGTVIYATVRPYLLNIAVINDDYEPEPIASTAFAIIHPYDGIIASYVYYYLRSPEFVRYVESQMKGMAYPAINDGKFFASPFPLPPLAEQERIVARVDELMALCDQLEVEQTERDHLREHSVKSTLYHLTDAPTQAEARRYWHYAEQNFPHLFDRSATVADLRATILQLAVQGRLVRQNPDDEPASDLLKRILIQRREMWELHTLSEYREKDKVPPKDWKKRYKEPDSPDTSELLSLPENWVWVYLGQITWLVKDGPHYSPQYTNNGIPFITGGNIRPDGVDFKNVKYISPELHKELSKRCKPELGDILYTKGGTTGIARVNTYDFEFNIWVHVAVLKLVKSMNPFYVQLSLNSPFCYEQSQNLTHGIGNKDLGLTRMVNIIMPLPPLHMQQQILAKVDELMALCDQLEAAADERRALSGRLFDSIVYHLFEGVE